MKTGLPRHLMMTCENQLRVPWERLWQGMAYVLALGDGSEVNLNLGLRQNVGRGGHVDEEVCCGRSSAMRSASHHMSNSSAK